MSRCQLAHSDQDGRRPLKHSRLDSTTQQTLYIPHKPKVRLLLLTRVYVSQLKADPRVLSSLFVCYMYWHNFRHYLDHLQALLLLLSYTINNPSLSSPIL